MIIAFKPSLPFIKMAIKFLSHSEYFPSAQKYSPVEIAPEKEKQKKLENKRDLKKELGKIKKNKRDALYIVIIQNH